MRLILSRKGFDSACGGVASPILPDGTLRPLPIPYAAGSRTFAELGGPAPTPAELVADLTRGRLTPATSTHLDPDLDPRAVPRPPGWRPAFGQHRGPQTHLESCGVGVGDLFLFFGWFREATRAGGRWRFVPGAPDVHLVWGWLQVDALHAVEAQAGGLPAPAWLGDHEHLRAQAHLGPKNTVYVAADQLRLGGDVVPGVAGAGVARRYRPELVLSAPGATRAVWRLPAWFHPGPARPPLTFHPNPAAWSPDGDHVRLDVARQGQEFVLDTREYPEAVPWARTLLAPEARA